MGSAKALEVLGWLVIILGIIAGIVVINQFGTTEAGWADETNPLGIAIGVGIMFEHVILGAFLIVMAHIGQNVYDVKRKLFGKATRVDVAEQAPAYIGDEKTDITKPTKDKEYVPKHEKPTEHDLLAIEASKRCWTCKNFSMGMFSSKGKCDVSNDKVRSDTTCKHFEMQM